MDFFFLVINVEMLSTTTDLTWFKFPHPAQMLRLTGSKKGSETPPKSFTQ